jgi:hypothetical protein
MSYSITTATGAVEIVIPDGEIDSTRLSVSLIGRNATNFGADVARNTVRLLENFANDTPPSAELTLTGQQWFDTNSSLTRVWDGSRWRQDTGIIVGPQAPTQWVAGGSAYFDTITNKLKVYDGNEFKDSSYAGEVSGAYATNTSVGEPNRFGAYLRTLFLQRAGDQHPRPVLALVYVSDGSLNQGATNGETIMAIFSDWPDFAVSSADPWFTQLNAPGGIGTTIKIGFSQRQEYAETAFALSQVAITAQNILTAGGNVSADSVIHTGRGYVPTTGNTHSIGSSVSTFANGFFNDLRIGNGTAGAVTMAGNVTVGESNNRVATAWINDLNATSITGNGAGITNINAAALAIGTIDPARIAGLNASVIAEGTLNSPDRVPNLPANKITSGVLAPARLGSGTANTDKYLRGDGTWQDLVIPGGTITSVQAGVGLTGGGSSGTVTLQIGTPGTLGGGTTNGANSTSHTHALNLAASDIPNLAASKITSGTFAAARLGSGTANSTTFLRGDGQWTAVSSGGGGTVTSVDSGAGLTGGPITGSGTLALTGQALALHNLNTNGMVVRTGAGSVAARTITGGAGIDVTNGNGVSGNPSIINSDRGTAQSIFKQVGNGAGTVQFSATNNNDMIRFAATGDATISFDEPSKTITIGATGGSGGGSDITSITAGTGLTGGGSSGAVQLALAGQALALHNLSANGFIVRTGSGSITNRSVAVSGSGITVANGDGVAGNPVITLASGSTNTPNTVVFRDGSGNFSAGTITASLSGNATSATSATTASNLTRTVLASGSGISASGSLNGGNVTITSNATNANTPSTIVFRDASGNFSAGTITASLSGNATSASSAAQLTTARSISATGDISWSVSFQGNTGVSSAATIQNAAVTFSKIQNISGPGVLGRTTGTGSVGAVLVDLNSMTTGELPVSRGGTGLTSVPNDSILVGTSGALVANTPVQVRGILDVPTRSGGNASGTWGISITGNAGSATALTTGRTINGTSFDGTANITTATWGTARTITIGGTGKSVNGSSNVAWTLAEIGAVDLTTNQSIGGIKTFTSTSASTSTTTGAVRVSGGVGVAGSINAGGNVVAGASDARLKINVVPISGALSKLAQISGVEYNWASHVAALGFKPSDDFEQGLLAQEVQKVIPNAVKPAPFNNNYLTVQYERVVPLLVSALNEERALRETLEGELAELKELLKQKGVI